MNPSRGNPVDPVLLGASGLVAGGLLLAAPCEVALAATLILVLMLVTRRTSQRVAIVAAIGVLIGALRARGAVARYDAERARADAALEAG
jgi:hypothetical protein